MGDNGVYKHEGKGDAASKTVEQNYSENNTSAGGEKMGETITWDSFVDYDTNEPAGEIDFDSYEAYKFLTKLKANVNHYKMSYGKKLAVKVYALQAGGNDKFDFKSKGNGDIYRGSRINIDGNNPVYMSARDVGNYGAGLAARMCDMNKLDYMLTAGAFQQHGNSKLDLLLNLNKYKDEVKQFSPSYGEHRRSNKAQRLGYEKIETSKEYKLKYNKVWSD